MELRDIGRFFFSQKWRAHGRAVDNVDKFEIGLFQSFFSQFG